MLVIVLIVAVLAMVIENYMLQRERNRREEKHERRKERFKSLLNLLKKPDADKNSEAGDITVVDDPDDQRDKS